MEEATIKWLILKGFSNMRSVHFCSGEPGSEENGGVGRLFFVVGGILAVIKHRNVHVVAEVH